MRLSIYHIVHHKKLGFPPTSSKIVLNNRDVLYFRDQV